MGYAPLKRRVIDYVPEPIAAKWGHEVLDEGFVPFPKRLLRCLYVVLPDSRDVAVVLAIADYARPNLLRPPSYDYLAFTANFSVRDFKHRVLDLQKRGLVTVQGEDEEVKISLDGLLKMVVKITNDNSRPDHPTPPPSSTAPSDKPGGF